MATLQPTELEEIDTGSPDPRSIINTNYQTVNEQQVRYIQLEAGENIAAWRPMYIAADGKFWLSAATNDFTKMPCAAISIEAKNAGQDIRGVYQGEVTNAAWAGWIAGQIAYLKTDGTIGTTGDPTTIDGAAFYYAQILGLVTDDGAGVHKLYVDCRYPFYFTPGVATTLLFEPRSAAPTVIGTRGALYTRNVGGTIKLYFKDNGGNIICISDFIYGISVKHEGDYLWISDVTHLEFGCGTVTDLGGGTIRYTPNILGDRDAGDYVAIAPDGQITLLGDARVERMIHITAPNWKKGATAPSDGFDGIFPTLDFATGSDDAAHYETWIPERWDNTTDMMVMLDWKHDTGAQTGKVLWKFVYLCAEPGDDPSAAGTEIVVLTAGNHAADVILRATFTTRILAANLVRMGNIGLKVWRNGNDVTDTLGEAARLINVHVHFTENRLGKSI